MLKLWSESQGYWSCFLIFTRSKHIKSCNVLAIAPGPLPGHSIPYIECGPLFFAVWLRRRWGPVLGLCAVCSHRYRYTRQRHVQIHRSRRHRRCRCPPLCRLCFCRCHCLCLCICRCLFHSFARWLACFIRTFVAGLCYWLYSDCGCGLSRARYSYCSQSHTSEMLQTGRKSLCATLDELLWFLCEVAAILVNYLILSHV